MIVVAAHGLERDRTHGGGRRSVRAADRRKSRASQNRGHGKSAARVPEPRLRGAEQAVAVACVIDHLAQQHKERDHRKAVVRKDRPDLRADRAVQQRGCIRGRIERQQSDEAREQHRQTRRHAGEQDEGQHDADPEIPDHGRSDGDETEMDDGPDRRARHDQQPRPEHQPLPLRDFGRRLFSPSRFGFVTDRVGRLRALFFVFVLFEMAEREYGEVSQE